MLALEKILANPAGKDAGKEWVEIRNLGPQTNYAIIEIFALKKEPQSQPRLLHREKDRFFAAGESKKLLLKNIPNQNTFLVLKVNGVESDRTYYDSAPENLVFGKSTVQKISGIAKNDWLWHKAESPPAARRELLVDGKENENNDLFAGLLDETITIADADYRGEYWRTVLNAHSRFLAERNTETQAVQKLKLLNQNPPAIITESPLFFWPLPIALLLFLLLQITTIERRQKSQGGRFTA